MRNPMRASVSSVPVTLLGILLAFAAANMKAYPPAEEGCARRGGSPLPPLARRVGRGAGRS